MNKVSEIVIKDLNHYCKHRCQHIIFNLHSEDVYYYKGQYKGYLYVIKLTSFMQKYKLQPEPKELYHLIKLQKNSMLGKYHKEPLYIKGILNALYDCLNYISH